MLGGWDESDGRDAKPKKKRVKVEIQATPDAVEVTIREAVSYSTFRPSLPDSKSGIVWPVLATVSVPTKHIDGTPKSEEYLHQDIMDAIEAIEAIPDA